MIIIFLNVYKKGIATYSEISPPPSTFFNPNTEAKNETQETQSPESSSKPT